MQVDAAARPRRRRIDASGISGNRAETPKNCRATPLRVRLMGHTRSRGRRATLRAWVV